LELGSDGRERREEPQLFSEPARIKVRWEEEEEG